MIHCKIDNFISSIMPFYCISKALGLAPLVIHKNESIINGIKFKTKVILNILYTFMIGSVIICLFVSHIRYFWKQIYPYGTVNFFVADLCSKLSLYGIPFVSVILSVFNKEELSIILQKIHEVDQKLSKKSNIYIKIFIFSILEVFLAICCIMILYEIIVITWGMDPFIFFYYETFTHVITLIVDLQFVNILMYVRYLFNTLNNELYSFVDNHSNENINTILFFKKFTVQNVHNLKTIYKELQEIVELINSYFRWQIVLETSGIFVHLVTTIFNWVLVIEHYFETNENCEVYLYRIYSLFCWIMFYVFKIFVISISGELCINQAHVTLNIIHKLLLNTNLSQETSKCLINFVFYTSCKRLRIKNGIFEIDMTLFHSVFAAALIYVTILFQIE
ncbi:hypothetical protein L9F63_014899, partial [Diploptera punctata]